MTAVVASASVYVPTAFAQQPSNADLADLVRQQAAQIERLESRLEALEDSGRAEAESSAGRSGSSNVAERRAQPADMAAGESDTSVAQLRKDVDELKDESVKVDWGSGAPKFVSPDGQFSFEIGGRIQYDVSSTFDSRYDGEGDQDGLDRNITGTEFRRIRLDASGQLMDPIAYKLELDFAGGSVGLRDVYLATDRDFELGTGTAYLGNKFTDSGFDGRTSSKWTWFTERNTVANAIQPETGAYMSGLTTEFHGKDDWHASLAVGKGSIGGPDNESDNLGILSRAHWNPVNTGDTIVHLGVNGFYENLEGDRVETFQDNVDIAGHYNDNLSIASALVDDPNQSTAFGFELGGLTGPFAAGAEWGRRDLDSGSGPDTHYTAYSGQIGYSITGEAFGYSTKQGVWSRPDVDNPVGKGGLGALQIMARYQTLDFQNSGQYAGGTGHASTIGLSWYLNSYTRALLDYSYWQTNNRVPIGVDPSITPGYYGDDSGSTINARAQVVF